MAATTIRHRSLWAGILGILLALFAHNLRAATTCSAQTWCIHPYWLRTWEMSYADGFTRRALVGWLLDAAPTATSSVIGVHIIAAGVLVGLTGFGILHLIHLFGSDWPAPVAAFLLGPTTMVFAETLGDVLQAALLLLYVSCLLSGNSRTVALWMFLPVSAAVHEASIFLLWPAALLILFRRHGLRSAIPIVGLVMMLGLIGTTLFPDQSVKTMLTFLAPNGSPIEIEALPAMSLREALAVEYRYHFDSPSQTLRSFYQLLSFSAWPLAFLIVLCRLRGSATLLCTYGLLIIFSAPLYVLAHDWSRFAVFTLLASLTLESLQERPRATEQIRQWAGTQWLEDRLIRLPLFLVYVFPVFFVAHPGYRTSGLLAVNLVQICSVLGISFAVTRRKTDDTSAQMARANADG